MTNGIIFKVIDHGSAEYKVAIDLRYRILRKLLGFFFSPEDLEKEQNYVQIIGLMGSNVVATAMLVPEGASCRMRMVAVEKVQRDQCVGSKMMVFCEAQAHALGFQSIYCHARDSAAAFYLRNGYVLEGDYFTENTIAHVKMRKSIGLKQYFF